jgi:hypothetical protein
MIDAHLSLAVDMIRKNKALKSSARFASPVERLKLQEASNKISQEILAGRRIIVGDTSNVAPEWLIAYARSHDEEERSSVFNEFDSVPELNEEEPPEIKF